MIRRTAAFLFALALLALPAGPATASGWNAPSFVRTISGPGEAGVYAWGMAWNPVTNEMLVGDYWNYLIRRYDMQGHQLGTFYRPASQRGGQPYTISVDARNGDIYFAELGNDTRGGDIARFDKSGTYISSFHPNFGYYAWATVDGRWLYVASGHSSTHPSIQKYDLDNGYALVTRWGTLGTGPGELGGELHGVDTDAAGNVYVADAARLMIHVYTADGVWLRDFGGPGTGLGQFTGDLRGLAIDEANGWVYVVDAEAGQVEKFDLAGDPLAHWGSVGSGPGQYSDGGRQATLDGAGHLWVADYGNFRFFEYDSNGVLLNTYPNPAQPPPAGHLSEVRDVAVDPSTGNVWAAYAWNNRFQEFAPDGSLLGVWGQRNSHPPYGMDYPRGIAVDPATGDVWVSDTRESLIRVYDRSGNYLFDVGTGLYSSDPGSFRFPLDIEFFAGKAYVSDWGQLTATSSNVECRLKILDATTGVELSSITVCNNGVAVDPATGNIYTVSSIFNKVSVFNPAGVQIGQFGSPGTGDGQFRFAWDADISNGILYVTDSRAPSVQAFTLAGTFLGKWGTKGQRASQVMAPSGISHDAQGRLYIADASNNRIAVLDPNTVGTPDTSKPSLAISLPRANQVLPAVSPALVTGTVIDADQVGMVEVAILDRSSGLWWNAKIALWQPTMTWNLASMTSSAATSGTFEFPLVGVSRRGSYRAIARAIDPWGNISATKAVSFTTSA